jgi:hypothetical protein
MAEASGLRFSPAVAAGAEGKPVGGRALDAAQCHHQMSVLR